MTTAELLVEEVVEEMEESHLTARRLEMHQSEDDLGEKDGTVVGFTSRIIVQLEST